MRHDYTISQRKKTAIRGGKLVGGGGEKNGVSNIGGLRKIGGWEASANYGIFTDLPCSKSSEKCCQTQLNKKLSTLFM